MSIVLNGTEWITWEDVREELLTEEEIKKSNNRVMQMCRQTPCPREKKLLQKNPKK